MSAKDMDVVWSVFAKIRWGILVCPPNNPLRYIGIFENTGYIGYIGVSDPQKEVLASILVSNGNLDKKHEVYWYFWPFFEKMRYIGMKPYIVVHVHVL